MIVTNARMPPDAGVNMPMSLFIVRRIAIRKMPVGLIRGRLHKDGQSVVSRGQQTFARKGLHLRAIGKRNPDITRSAQRRWVTVNARRPRIGGFAVSSRRIRSIIASTSVAGVAVHP